MTKRVSLWLLFFGFVLYRVKLLWQYSFSTGYDFYSHVDYVRMVAGGTFPAPDRLWQAYQAPGYYAVSAWFANLLGTSPITTAQTVSLVASVLVAIPGIALARKLVPGWEPLVATILVAIPSSIHTAPMVYPQQLATLCIGFFLLVLQAAWRQAPSLKLDTSLALFWAAAAWCRHDGLMLGLPVLCLFLVRLKRSQNLRERAEALCAFGYTSLLVAYPVSASMFRNLAKFNTLVLTNRHPKIYPYFLSETNILPDFFSATTLVNPGVSLLAFPFSFHLESLYATYYASFWGVSYGPSVILVPLQLWTGLAFLALALWGLKATLKDQRWHPVMSVALANFVLVASFVTRQPDHTNFKAAYLHGAYFLFALSVAKGVQIAETRFGERIALALGVLPLVVIGLGCLLH